MGPCFNYAPQLDLGIEMLIPIEYPYISNDKGR